MGSERSTGIAIIVAGGSGKRFGSKKQYADIDGYPMYYYSIKAFSPVADRIILVVPKEDVDIVESYGVEVVAGGEERYNSVYNGLLACIDAPEDAIIMIHDAARPGITTKLIRQLMKETEEYDAVVPTIPIADTVRTVDGELLDRSKIRGMQTPQCFKHSIIKQAYDKLMSLPQEARDKLKITDDVQVVDVMMGIKSHQSEGDIRNRKITTKEDM